MSGPTDSTRSARRFWIRGRVQGVGFRPAAVRVAQSLGLVGNVRNTRAGVELLVEGGSAQVAEFLARLQLALPSHVTIESVASELVPLTHPSSFRIDLDPPSDSPDSPEAPDGDERPTVPLQVRVPADRRVCEACLAEIRDPLERRLGYPFASCVECGPRYSLIECLPYERRQTTMRRFPPCDACSAEENSPHDRRFHAQTLACAACGPRLEWKPGDGLAEPAAATARVEFFQRSATDVNELALDAACRALRQGQIVAVRGLGGYQLLVDARHNAAVARLRTRKGRRDKPLAVLVPSLEAARALVQVDDAIATALASGAGPIVVAPLRAFASLAWEVTRGAETLGVFLPTTPLHALLADRVGACVATSGNHDGEPLAYDPANAEAELAAIADGWLHHDRPIARPIDDSVTRVMAGELVTLRLARGQAPLALSFESLADVERCTPHVALGGHQKSAVALWNGSQAALGPHLGDLETAVARQRFAEQVESLQRLYGVESPRFVCDLHPDYASSRWAQERLESQRAQLDSATRGSTRPLPALGVQHHEAHVAATMVEHELLDRPVLGVAWDGTGLGTDGTIWGGEFMIGKVGTWTRRARWRPFVLLGGEQAIREPWRVAAAILRETFGPDEKLERRFLGDDCVARLRPLGNRPWPGIMTSSVGRLCDAIAVLLGGMERLPSGEVTFDGQLPMWLEDQAWRAAAPGDSLQDAYPVPVVAPHNSLELWELDWRPLVTRLVADRLADQPTELIAARFHRTLAAALGQVAERFSGVPIVAGGGVFQNRWLVEQLAAMSESLGRPVYWPRRIPPNDGGLAAGQLALALVRQTESFRCA